MNSSLGTYLIIKDSLDMNTPSYIVDVDCEETLLEYAKKLGNKYPIIVMDLSIHPKSLNKEVFNFVEKSPVRLSGILIYPEGSLDLVQLARYTQSGTIFLLPVGKFKNEFTIKLREDDDSPAYKVYLNSRKEVTDFCRLVGSEEARCNPRTRIISLNPYSELNTNLIEQYERVGRLIRL